MKYCDVIEREPSCFALDEILKFNYLVNVLSERVSVPMLNFRISSKVSVNQDS